MSNRTFQLLDICAIIICAVIMYRVRNSFWIPTGNYQLLLLVILFLSINVFTWADVYKPKPGRWLYKSLTNLTIAWFAVAMCLSMITFFTKSGENFSRLWVLMTFTSAYALMVLSRIAIWSYQRGNKRLAQNQRHVVVIGAGELGKRACDAIREERWAGLKVVGLFDDDTALHGSTYKDTTIMGNVNQALLFIEKQRQTSDAAVKEVWIALPIKASEKIEQLQLGLQNTATNIYFVPDLFGANLSRYSLVESAGMMMINLSGTPMVGALERLKRAEDIVISLLMGIILSPFLALIAAIIKFESPGPIFFKQRRYGLDGKEILVWKFRSMTVCEDNNEIIQAVPNDKRVTRFGAFIRKYSIDELPQLINVLNGTMSLVGPRPHAVAHNEYYRDKVHGYMARHKIRPGMTGWAQINGCRGETDAIEKMQRRIRYDLEYIQNWSIALDIRILLKTFYTVLRDRNAY
jgi:putative colanic acid biosynthesis UDP-glucose lipid carrier transferase